MNKKISFVELAKGITNIAQLGLSFITPIILCALLGTFLRNRYGISDIAVLIIILLGFLSGVASFITFVKSYLKSDCKKGGK